MSSAVDLYPLNTTRGVIFGGRLSRTNSRPRPLPVPALFATFPPPRCHAGGRELCGGIAVIPLKQRANDRFSSPPPDVSRDCRKEKKRKSLQLVRAVARYSYLGRCVMARGAQSQTTTVCFFSRWSDTVLFPV